MVRDCTLRHCLQVGAVNAFTGKGLRGNLAVYTTALRFMAWRPCVYRALWGQGEFSQRDRSRECVKLTERTVRAGENVFIHDHIQRAVGWERPVSEQHAWEGLAKQRLRPGNRTHTLTDMSTHIRYIDGHTSSVSWALWLQWNPDKYKMTTSVSD